VLQIIVSRVGGQGHHLTIMKVMMTATPPHCPDVIDCYLPPAQRRFGFRGETSSKLAPPPALSLSLARSRSLLVRLERERELCRRGLVR
jgi:hypothetical protein